MRRALATAALLAACAAAWLATPAIAGAATPALATTPAGVSATHTVVLVLAPYLVWGDVTPTATPTLWSFAERGAIGNINTRSRARALGELPTAFEGPLSISAGNWALHAPGAPAAYDTSERYGGGRAGEAFTRLTGTDPGEADIVFLGFPRTDRINTDRSADIVVGTLGDSLTSAGILTAAVGNSDLGYSSDEQLPVRPTPLVAMDRSGRVALGGVSRKLLESDPDAPYGLRADAAQAQRLLDRVSSAAAAERTGALVVVDPGDLYRAVRFSAQVTPEVAASQRAVALRGLDEALAAAYEQFPEATFIIASQSTGDPESGPARGFGPIVITGPSPSGEPWPAGLLTSDSTHRDGVVTNLDIAATIMSLFGVERPVQVSGNDMRASEGGSTEDRVARLVTQNDTAVAIDGVKPAIVSLFAGLVVFALALSAFVIARAHRLSERLVGRAALVLKAVLLLALCVPVGALLMFAIVRWPGSALTATAALLIATLTLWLLSLLVWRYAPLRVPVAAVSAVTVLAVLVDQWSGGLFSFTNLFGFSPLLGGRFYGLGNEAAAVVFGASILAMVMVFDQWRGEKWVDTATRFGIPVVAAIVVFTSSAPFFGANVGVVVWGVAGYALLWILANGRRVTWSLIAWVFVAVVVVIGGFAVLDLLGGGAQTHLGRALVSARQGGMGELWVIVSRKAAMNARILTHTNWAYILIGALGFLAFMRFRPQGDFAEALAENPYFADAITVFLVAGVVAFFTEDSGIVIPALTSLYLGSALAWLMLSRLTAAQRDEVRS